MCCVVYPSYRARNACWQLVAAIAASTITLAWNARPASGTHTSYNLYYGVASATCINVVGAGTSGTACMSGVVDGTSYYSGVTAVDGSRRKSNYSAEVSTVIPVNQPLRREARNPSDVVATFLQRAGANVQPPGGGQKYQIDMAQFADYVKIDRSINVRQVACG